MLYSQGPCKCQPSRWYFERQSVWFGVWVFFFPSSQNSFRQTHSRQQPMKFYHGNQLLDLLGNVTKHRKGVGERKIACFMSLQTSLLKKVGGPLSVQVCTAHLSSYRLFLHQQIVTGRIFFKKDFKDKIKWIMEFLESISKVHRKPPFLDLSSSGGLAKVNSMSTWPLLMCLPLYL